MIISVHLPKTAGVSFSAALEQHFGRALQREYTDFPINTPSHKRNRAALQAALRIAETEWLNIECIHGHFLPIKYLLAADGRKMKFVTWMRNPVDRVLSHYYFWKRSYDPQTAPSLHRKVIVEDWPVERFVLAEETRNLYCQFLWGFPIEYFDFIGITEFFDADLEYFANHYLGTTIEAKKLNVGDKDQTGYRIDPSLRKEVEAFHARDMDLYERALTKRQMNDFS